MSPGTPAIPGIPAPGVAPVASPAIATPLLATAWSAELLTWTLNVSIVVVALCMLLCIARVIRGPHLADRALGADTLAIQLIGLVILLSMRLRTLMFFDGMLVLSLLGFAGTVAVAQYIGRPHLRRLRAKSKVADPHPHAPGGAESTDGGTPSPF